MHVRAAEIIYKLHGRTSSARVLEQVKWYPLRWHYKYKLALVVHKSIKSVTPLGSLFQSRNNFHTLRGENKLPLAQPISEILKKSFAYRGIRQ